MDELGGAKYEKCIRLKMKYLFSDEVLEYYSWNGTSIKSAFKQLKAINNLVLKSVRNRCPKTKRDEYEGYLSHNWLKHAKSRQRTVTYTYPKKKNRDEDDDDEGDYNDEDSDF